MMKRIPKAVKVTLGVAEGAVIAMMMVKLLPSLAPVSDMLAIVNCAFGALLMTLGEEEDVHLPVALLFWLVAMSLLVCPVMARFAPAGVLKGFGYAAVLLAGAYVMMRVRLAMIGVKYDSLEAGLYRLILYDDLYRRFFGRSLMNMLDDDEDEDGEE